MKFSIEVDTTQVESNLAEYVSNNLGESMINKIAENVAVLLIEKWERQLGDGISEEIRKYVKSEAKGIENRLLQSATSTQAINTLLKTDEEELARLIRKVLRNGFVE